MLGPQLPPGVMVGGGQRPPTGGMNWAPGMPQPTGLEMSHIWLSEKPNCQFFCKLQIIHTLPYCKYILT